MVAILRYAGIACLISILAIGLSILYGMLFPVPVVEWTSYALLLQDTRTGVNYRMERPITSVTNAHAQVSGVDNIQSPNQVNLMTLIGTSTGLEVLISDAGGHTLLSLYTGRDVNISNVAWLDDWHILVMRVTFSSGNFDLNRINVETGEEHFIGVYDNSFVVLSPGRNWLLLSERSTGYTEIINMWDDRHYEIKTVSVSFAWSNDGQYLASRTESNGNFGFQLVDTETGQLIIDDMPPYRLTWSNNNQDLLVYNERSVHLYHDMQRIIQFETDHPIAGAQWSPDGRYAYLLTSSVNDSQVYLIDLTQDNPIRWLSSIPRETERNSLTWSIDSPILTYIVHSSSSDESLVYGIHIDEGTTELITRIPSQIRQVRYFVNLANYGNLP